VQLVLVVQIDDQELALLGEKDDLVVGFPVGGREKDARGMGQREIDLLGTQAQILKDAEALPPGFGLTGPPEQMGDEAEDDEEDDGVDHDLDECHPSVAGEAFHIISPSGIRAAAS